MSDMATILVGDIGGTNARFALAEASAGGLLVKHIWKRRGEDFATFDAAIDAFRKDVPAKIDGVSLGVAGPVRDDRAQLLHRDWSIDGPHLAGRLGVARAVIVNDFMPMARSAPDLPAGDLREITPGDADPGGAVAVGGPGTGFGLAVLRRIGKSGWVVIGGEGGHQAFAPQSRFEWEVAERLSKSVGYVSNEIVAAGAGFEATLAAVADVMGQEREPLTPADVEARAAKGDPLSLEMCRLRAATVMTALGDAVLSVNATGGVFVAGGVAVKLQPYLKEEEALARFYERGPRRDLMSRIPIKMIVSEEAPLLGAARLWLDDRARGWL
ncbi:MAG: glucokinase [Alphaproteobacteria bacterium]|nr:glucokinase [Alphaproteobacteria bacterium]